MRLLSINAPEVAIDGKAEQPLARASREAVEAFFADTDTVHLSFESRRTDRYGRILAHATHPSGRNLESYLVRQGLALPLAVPPDLAFASCLQAQADQARRENKGLWNTTYWQPLPASRLAATEEGFRLVCGRITRLDRQVADLWVELEGGLVIRIARDDFPFFRDSDFDLDRIGRWPGRWLQVSGWLQDRRDNRSLMRQGFKPWSVQARTPYALRWLEAAEACE